MPYSLVWSPSPSLACQPTLTQAVLPLVAEGKNANYISAGACDSGHWHFDTCDRNDRSYYFPVAAARVAVREKSPTVLGS